MRRLDPLLTEFQERFESTPDCAAVAPGRVNLIGEHTDYNEGFVLPMAIELGVTVLARSRQDRRVRAVALDCDDEIEVDLGDGPVKCNTAKPWSNYVLGTIASLADATGTALYGMDLLFSGDLPIGGGLSSSAAVEVATAIATCELAGLDVLPRKLATICQQAEHEYAGVNCGIMDQFIAAHGQRGHALLLDCRDLSYAMIEIATPGVEMLVVHSGISHGLADSAYNERRRQCEEGLAFLAERMPSQVRSLRDVSIDDLLTFHEKMDPTVVTRCRHVITENERVQDFAEALGSGEAERCGRLLTASHMSLRQDYEVSCKELDLLVDLATATPGVYGARMVGAGFGGCMLALVAMESITAAEQSIAERYAEQTGIDPLHFRVHASDGGHSLKLHETV